MAKVFISQHSFNDDNGVPVNYERLSISGYVGGEVHTLELKLEKSELLLAKMLLTSNEEKPEQVARAATAEEKDFFNKQHTDDKIHLEEDD